MRERQIAVCSREREYVLRFTEFANRRQASMLSVHGFTDCAELSAYTKEHPIDILLLSEELSEELPKKEEYGSVILLAEEEYRSGAEREGGVLYKYQSCSRILQQAMNFYAEQATVSSGTVLRTGALQRIGLYSPVGRSGKTDFALTLGKELAKKKRTLYLNLEAYSGFESLYPSEEGWSLSELLYFVKQGKPAFGWKLEGLIRSMGELDYIPPLRSPVEYESVTRKDWKRLLELLEEESRYEVVLLDLSEAADGWYELLEDCQSIYMPVARDERAEAKVRQYEESMRQLGLEAVLERTQKLDLSAADGLEQLAKAEGKRWCGP